MGDDTTIMAVTAPETKELNLDQPNGTLAMATRKFRIPGDLVAKAVAGLPDDQREAVKWLEGYGRQKNLTLEELALRVKKHNGSTYSAHSLYCAFTGRREEGVLANLVESIKHFRRLVQEPETAGSSFVETSLSRKIFSTCARAFAKHRLTFIFGESQIGKSTALTEYARLHNHGETHLVRMPTGGTLGNLLEEFSIQLGIPAQNKVPELRRRVMECFDDRTLVMVDECHQCFSGGKSSRPIDSIEFLREIYDRRKCGMVLCGTNIFKEGLTRGPNAKRLRQLWLRGFAPLQLPSVPGSADMDKFSATFGLSSAPDKNVNVQVIDVDEAGNETTIPHTDNPLRLQTDVVKVHGLGRWISILDEARDDAQARSQRISWGRVILCHARFKAMEEGL